MTFPENRTAQAMGPEVSPGPYIKVRTWYKQNMIVIKEIVRDR